MGFLVPKGFQLWQQTPARAYGPEVSSEPSDESSSTTGTPEQEGEPGLRRPPSPFTAQPALAFSAHVVGVDAR